MSSIADVVPLQPSPPVWQPPAPLDILRWPLPSQRRGNRWLMRTLAVLGARQVISLRGLSHVQAGRDPFIVALNHNNRSEALLIPTLMMLHRHGKLIHFLADWNYSLIPGIGLIYRRAEIITLTRKPARPRILNRLKPFYRHPLSGLERARLHLQQGRSIGLFPEGSVNRHPLALLHGRRGAAYLSLATGAPVVPVGIRFPEATPGRPISDLARMDVDIGEPLVPARLPAARIKCGDIRAWHAAIMIEIAKLSGKTWNPSAPEIHDACQ